MTEGLWTYLCVCAPDVLVCGMFGCELSLIACGSCASSYNGFGSLTCCSVMSRFCWRWIIFIYHSPLVRKVTNLFKNTDIHIAFKANNTIYQQLAQKADNRNPSGIYEIKCNTCSKNYVGLSGRPITIRHKEHIRGL